jgi:FAD:protein FMN transferase
VTGAAVMDVLISPRRRAFMGGLGAASLLAACGQTRAPTVLPLVEFGGLTMGSVYTVKIVGRGLSQALQSAARGAVAAALDAVDTMMSTHRPQSELSRLNARTATSPLALSADLFSVFALARQVSASTAGAFDVTVGPIVDAWGFGPGRRERLVGDIETAALERRIGWKMLGLDQKAGTISKLDPRVRADLSGIAKGYGVDKAAQALDALGIEHYLIEAGGEVRTRGHNPQGRPWQVAIEQPTAGPRQPRYVVPLSGLAMATSGDYRIFFERDGRRYSHEINPATGRPIDNALTSVSVVASSGALADAMGKLIVLGPQKAYECAMSLGLAAHFILREPGGKLRDVMTPAFAALGGHLLNS